MALHVFGNDAPPFNLQALDANFAGILNGSIAFSTVSTSSVAGTSSLTLGNVQGSQWQIPAGANAPLIPLADALQNLGGTANRVAVVYAVSVDSGTTGSLSLKTNNGSEHVRVVDSGGTPNTYIHIRGGNAGAQPLIGSNGGAGSPDLGIFSSGTGNINFYSSGATLQQFQVLHTASATRNITVTGSNGGNPTINVTGGSLAITPTIVLGGLISMTGVTPIISASTDVAMGFGQAGVQKWNITNNAGGNSWVPITDNASDIGASGLRCRNGFFAGTLQFGTNTAKAAEVFTSYITVTDAGGTTRKLMVCA